MDIEKIFDVFLFREGTDTDNDTEKPVVTTGSIVLGVIIRSALIVVISFLLIEYYDSSRHWYLMLFFIWLFAAYPGYRQYKVYNERIENFAESTLCGSCRSFDKTSQLCRIYDEHVSTKHIPCDGDSWEPKDSDF